MNSISEIYNDNSDEQTLDRRVKLIGSESRWKLVFYKPYYMQLDYYSWAWGMLYKTFLLVMYWHGD